MTFTALDVADDAELPSYLAELHIRVIELNDIGLVHLRADSSSEDVNDDAKFAEWTDLGLPLSFGSSKRKLSTSRSKKKRHRREKTHLQRQTLSHLTSLDASSQEHISPAALRKSLGRPLFKYWLQRYSLFSKFDQGIHLDKEAWYSTTPESIAYHHASKIGNAPSLVLDAFCGVGGNAIQFALQGHCVIAVDHHSERLQMAKHNAQIYGVENRIEFLLADAFDVTENFQVDAVFVSPPWGGPNYTYQDAIILSETDLGDSISRLLHCLSRRKPRITLYLPRNVDLCSLLDFDFCGFRMTESEVTKLNGVVKALTVYLS